jgi:FkbM family methyltransferase
MTLRLLAGKMAFRLRRLQWRAVTALTPGDPVHTFRLPGGVRFEYPLKSAIGADLYAGWFEPAELGFVRSRIKPGDVVIDLGANAGLYTVIAAQLCGPSGHVYAFEPGSRAVELLRRNVALNGLTNVTVINAAVSDETGYASFGEATDTAMSSLATTDREDQTIAGWHSVRTLRLDDAVTEFGIPTPRFIKVDVEGAEKLAFEGGERTLADAADLTILFEAFDGNARPFGYTARDLLASMAARGFELHGFDASLALRPIESFPHDALGTTVFNSVAYKPVASRPATGTPVRG